MGKLKYISYLKVIGIILVVFGHSFHQWNGVFEDTILYKVFMVMRMPLFTFTSGYTLAYCFVSRSSNRTFKDFIANKAWRLLLPFFILNTVTFIPRALMSSIADDALELSISSYLSGLFFYQKGAIIYLWFLQMSFVCMVITYPILLYIKNAQVRSILLCSLLLIAVYTNQSQYLRPYQFFALNQVGNLFIFFIAGTLCGTEHKRFITAIQWTNKSCLILCLFGWLGCFAIATVYSLQCASLLSSIFGIMMTLSLALIIEKKHITILNHLAGSTYMIFLLSWFANVSSQQILHHFVELPWWIHSALSLVCGIYVPLIIHRFLESDKEKHPYKRAILFLLGHK